MSDIDKHVTPSGVPTGHVELPPAITTEEAAVRWAEEVVLRCEEARRACDAILPSQGEALVIEMRRRQSTFLVHHGNALGTVATLLRLRMISPNAYNLFVVRIRSTLLESVVGTV